MKQFVDSFIIESGENVLPKHLLVPGLKMGGVAALLCFYVLAN